jgi:hypothetical protein
LTEQVMGGEAGQRNRQSLAHKQAAILFSNVARTELTALRRCGGAAGGRVGVVASHYASKEGKKTNPRG